MYFLEINDALSLLITSSFIFVGQLVIGRRYRIEIKLKHSYSIEQKSTITSLSFSKSQAIQIDKEQINKSKNLIKYLQKIGMGTN